VCYFVKYVRYVYMLMEPNFYVVYKVVTRWTSCAELMISHELKVMLHL